MPEKYWSENEPEQELDPIGSLLSELVDLEDEEEEFRSDFFQGLSGRRKKAAFVLMVVWGATILLHLVTWGTWVVMGVTGLLLIQGLRWVSAKPKSPAKPLSDEALANAPFVSLLVSAKNEEAVISHLMTMLCNLDYPTDKYEVWAIDDHSTDKTPQILARLAQQHSQLKVMHRPAGASGGKSGALNQVLPLTRGEIIGVFDADAKVTRDLLRRVVPIFEEQDMGAVQVRKAIANPSVNFWTRGQKAEMALDSYFQQQRIAVGGIGELRGNGQFARRRALERCGGWNEQTITDDLDLTIRLHLDNWQIGFLLDPEVEEEGVTSAIALWHQRNRWAEGGYQRYLDYWRLIVGKRMDFRKKLDMLTFVLLQYLVPTAAVPDFVMAIARHRLPLFSPLTGFMLSLSFWGMLVGLHRTRTGKKLSFSHLLSISWQTLRGMVYMLHWLAIVPSVTARMSVRPKRLKWVKTVHEGTSEESLEFQ
jgi:1,2-diacylglycerol 3-beta-glucosyltransferase